MTSQTPSVITWNIVNSCLAGGLVALGSISGVFLNMDTILGAKQIFIAVASGVIAGAVVAVTKFKDFWATNEVVSSPDGTPDTPISTPTVQNQPLAVQLFHFF